MINLGIPDFKDPLVFNNHDDNPGIIVYPNDVSGYDVAHRLMRFYNKPRLPKSKPIELPAKYSGTYVKHKFDILFDLDSAEITSESVDARQHIGKLVLLIIQEIQKPY